MTVLVTCVGSGVGQSVVDSLNLKREFKIIGCDGNPNVYAHNYCDEFILVPGLYSPGYIDHILQICIENKVDLLIPGHDHELILFAKEYDKFKSSNIEVIVSEPEIISISRDKRDWYNFFSPLGCRIVPTMLVSEFIENPDESYLPAIVKPSGGSASQGISIVNEMSELEGLNDFDIIQPYLFPEKIDENYERIVSAVKKGSFIQLSEISIQLIFDEDSRFLKMFISKNSLKNGVPVFVDPLDPEEFEYTDEILKFVPILEKQGARGPVNIQGRVTSKGIFFFEMNLRFTGITGTRALLGFNEVDYLVRRFLGLPSKIDGYTFNKVGVRQVACGTIPNQVAKKEKDTLTILGGGSKVGQKFVLSTCNDFYQVNLIVRETSIQKYKNLFGHLENVTLVEDNAIELEQVLCKTDVLINFISALAYEEHERMFDAVLFLQRITTKIAKTYIPKIINISSQSVYPQDVNLDKTESHPVQFKTAYAFQKLIIERLFTDIKEFSPLSNVTSLRLSRVIIPDLEGQPGFFKKLITDYTNGKTVQIDYPENNTNLIHIVDVVKAITFIMNKMDEMQFPSAINVGGENISLRNYIELIEKKVKGKGNFILSDSFEVKKSSLINVSYINSLDWQAKFSIENILNDLI